MPSCRKGCGAGDDNAKSVRSIRSLCSERSTSDSYEGICGKPKLPFEELKQTLAEIIKENYYDIEQALIKFDRQNTGKILRSQMKLVLRSYCLPLTINQFNCIVPQCNVDLCGKVYYREFLEEMTGWTTCHGTRDSKNTEAIPKNCTVDELESMLKYRMERNLKNVTRAFCQFDIKKDGFLKKRDIRKVIEKFCFKVTNAQFDAFWDRRDPLQIGGICYGDLICHLGVDGTKAKRYLPRETVPKSLCWPVKSVEDCHSKLKLQQIRKKYLADNKEDECIKGLDINDTLKVFIKKLQAPGLLELLTNACLMYDMRNSGFIFCEDFHALLCHFVLPMSEPLFMQLMGKCLPPSRSARRVCWKEFLREYCNPGTPLSQTPECQPYFDMKIPITDSLMSIIERMKRHIIDPMGRLGGCITAEDMDEVKLFNRMEVKKLVQQMNFFLTEDEFRELFAVLDPGHTNYVKIQDFLTLFDYPIVPPCPVLAPYNTQAILAPCKRPYKPGAMKRPT